MLICVFCFFKQKTAYEVRISDWSSDVCSSDLVSGSRPIAGPIAAVRASTRPMSKTGSWSGWGPTTLSRTAGIVRSLGHALAGSRSEEHTSELQSLMRISYAVFCLKKKKHNKQSNAHRYIETVEH